MNYLELLKETAKRFNSIVCLGMDPVIEDIPITTGSVKERIVAFYAEMLDAIEKRKVYPAAVKPNYAFYAQYGLEGIEALPKRFEVMPVDVDAVKRFIETHA